MNRDKNRVTTSSWSHGADNIDAVSVCAKPPFQLLKNAKSGIFFVTPRDNSMSAL